MSVHIDQRLGAAGTTTRLWAGAGITAFAAVLFPRLNAVFYDHETIWHLDHEATILAPTVVVATVAMFALVGLPCWRGADNRTALAGLITGIVSILGIVAFWLSAPLIFGGLAVTLSVEGLRRADAGHQRRRLALAGTILGALGAAAGAALWVGGA